MSIRDRMSGNEAIATAMRQINPDVFAKEDRLVPPYQREQLFRVVGSSSMVFTKKGLSMLTPYPEDPVNHQDGTGMAVKEMRTRLGLTQEELSLKIGIPEEIIREWELGKQEPPEHLIQLMEQLVRMKENGEPDSCLRYHVSADIYLSPSLMDVLYERGVILRERDVTADVVESELEKYIGAFAEVQSIRVDEIRTPGYRPEEYYGVDIAEAMAACPEMAQKLEKGEISALDLKAAYKKMMKKTDKTG